MKNILLVGLVLLLVLSGCSGKEVKNEKTAKELAEEGTVRYEDGNFMGAVESFQRLKEWYPFSDLATLAELKIADAYYHMEKYPEASQWYVEFENLHPNNEAIPYVIYQTGRCSFDELEKIDQDPTFGRKALNIFSRLIREYPNDPYALRAAHHIDECYKRLAGNEFYIGRFYYKEKNYKAALLRFKNVISNYPDVGVHGKALQYISQCENKIKLQAEKPEDPEDTSGNTFDSSHVTDTGL
ncbi:MAG: outer membrane protein assembly factor BamD [Proteobacteria bacterium]|nr:outer membrane protein assembly factor BamD [Pseudomonadota bacterium]MBU4469734.1 outer membrane protein assembly factor BamD [Pseudomonadota bacterium]MCG2753886.1 outer membrane protein assembly factor BamD [Desulfobacteraceae bacterium]